MRSLAMKIVVLPTAVKLSANEFDVPVAISFNRNVPASVPSLRHGSRPLVVANAWKYSKPFATVSPDGTLEDPLLTDLTIVVPPDVPSLRNSDHPAPFEAAKNTAPLYAVMPVGTE